ncbi:hypothetical protein [Thioalkalivibrio sulfidiphilus]|uniref:hypothetical protein n=1 Tax=Thioalkalivibrio sulfidiphilus TaxID=1033854 RepID=UPI003B33813B
MTTPPIRTVTFGATSWNDPRLIQALYPEDTPPDWRLSCYASHFDTVLVAEAEWRGADPTAWLESLQSQFWFYLRVETPLDVAGLAQLVTLVEGLGERLGGVVLDAPAASVEAALRARLPALPVFTVTGAAGPGRVWTGEDSPCPCGMVGWLRFETRPTPRELRAALEGFLACQNEPWSVLFLDAPAESFEEARVIGQLLGVS